MTEMYYERLELKKWFKGEIFTHEKIEKIMKKLGYKKSWMMKDYTLFQKENDKGKEIIRIEYEPTKFKNLKVTDVF